MRCPGTAPMRKKFSIFVFPCQFENEDEHRVGRRSTGGTNGSLANVKQVLAVRDGIEKRRLADIRASYNRTFMRLIFRSGALVLRTCDDDLLEKSAFPFMTSPRASHCVWYSVNW